MICPYCGAENSDSSTFCDLCLNVFNAPGAGMQAPFAPSAGEPPAPPEYGQPPQPGYGQGFVAGQPPGPAYDLGAGRVDPGSVPPAANQVPRGAIPPQALQSDAYWHMEWATDSKIKELKEIRDRPKAPIDQVRDLYPEDHTWYSLYGFAVAVAGAGAVFFLLATNFFIRFFIIASMPSPSSSGTEVAAANHLSLVGIIIGSLIVVGVVFALSYLVGFRGARLGAIMGGVCAGHLVVFQGISFLLLANWVFKLMRTVNGGGFQLKWWHLGLGLLVLVPIGMLAGWVGQNVALNRTFGNLSFNQLLSSVGIGLAALLFIVGIGGLVKGAIAKPTTSNLSAAFMSMKQMTGWQANISGVDGSETLLYEKGKGFKTDTTIVMTEGKAYKYNKVSEKWNESPPGVDFDFLDNDALAVVTVTGSSKDTHDGVPAIHYDVTYSTMTPFGVVNQYSDSLSQSGSMNGDIYTSEDNSRILEMDFSGGLAGGEATVTFSRFNEDVFGAGGIMAKPASASPVAPYRSSTPSYSTPTTPSSRKYLSSISPSSAPNTGSVKVEVSGSGFTSSTMVSLVMSGAPTITGVASAVSPYKMTCTFNLGGSMPGEYKVYLDNSPSYETFFVEGNNAPGSPTPTTTSPDWSPY